MPTTWQMSINVPSLRRDHVSTTNRFSHGPLSARNCVLNGFPVTNESLILAAQLLSP
jgi:hypothetical protein